LCPGDLDKEARCHPHRDGRNKSGHDNVGPTIARAQIAGTLHRGLVDLVGDRHPGMPDHRERDRVDVELGFVMAGKVLMVQRR
jgi:hypothetical protein